MYNNTLEDKITEYERDITRLKKNLDKAEQSLEDLKTRNTVSIKELYNGIESYITIKVDDKEYEEILGRDGRSRPWSENKVGKVADVFIKEGIYLDDTQRKVVRKYVLGLLGVEHVDIYYEKIKGE